jgi:hypothetical protein
VTGADKIVAAILTASKCAGKDCDHDTYVRTYDEFLGKLAELAERGEAEVRELSRLLEEGKAKLDVGDYSIDRLRE